MLSLLTRGIKNDTATSTAEAWDDANLAVLCQGRKSGLSFLDVRDADPLNESEKACY